MARIVNNRFYSYDDTPPCIKYGDMTPEKIEAALEKALAECEGKSWGELDPEGY